MTSRVSVAGLDLIHPSDCKELADLRGAIDQIDALMLDLLKARYDYTDTAARLKLRAGRPVHDEERIRFQVGRAGDLGEKRGIPRPLIEPLWRFMIERHMDFEHAFYEQAKAEQQTS